MFSGGRERVLLGTNGLIFACIRETQGHLQKKKKSDTVDDLGFNSRTGF